MYIVATYCILLLVTLKDIQDGALKRCNEIHRKKLTLTFSRYVRSTNFYLIFLVNSMVSVDAGGERTTRGRTESYVDCCAHMISLMVIVLFLISV